VHRARSKIGLSTSVLLISLALAGCEDQAAFSRSGSDIGDRQIDRIRPASRDIDRDRRDRRDRAGRRLGRGGAELLPHLGDYVVHESGFTTARFKRAQGTLTVNLTNDCGDWSLQEKWDLELQNQSDEVEHSNMLYRASEVTSTDRFRFAYSLHHLGEETDFIGDVLPVDGGFQAIFSTPEIADLFMPSDVVFPITHLRQVVASARRQREEFEAIVFDGGNGFPYRAVTTINRERRRDDRNPRVAAARTELDQQTSDLLPPGRNWPVRIDYFPEGDPNAPPVFTREFLLHENGIVLSFHFDYGDVQLDARLKNLDIHNDVDCPRQP